VQKAGKVPAGSVVYKMLRRKAPYIVPDTATDAYFGGRRFSRDEEIASLIAVPLVANDEKVGVMFVNYRSRKSGFSAEELADVDFFADQAAIELYRARDHDRAQARLENLYRASQAITSGFTLQDTL